MQVKNVDLRWICIRQRQKRKTERAKIVGNSRHAMPVKLNIQTNWKRNGRDGMSQRKEQENPTQTWNTNWMFASLWKQLNNLKDLYMVFVITSWPFFGFGCIMVQLKHTPFLEWVSSFTTLAMPFEYSNYFINSFSLRKMQRVPLISVEYFTLFTTNTQLNSISFLSGERVATIKLKSHLVWYTSHKYTSNLSLKCWDFKMKLSSKWNAVDLNEIDRQSEIIILFFRERFLFIYSHPKST